MGASTGVNTVIELQLAQARLELAKSDYARAQKLLEFRAISQEEADTRAATERQAQQSVEAARANVKAAKLNVGFTRVTAPISGRISRKLVTEGNLINGGTAESTLNLGSSVNLWHEAITEKDKVIFSVYLYELPCAGISV